MKRNTMVAVFVQGPQNITRVTYAALLSDETLEKFAWHVARKKPGWYDVYEVNKDTWKRKSRAEPLFHWHEGEGFTHREGWWVS